MWWRNVFAARRQFPPTTDNEPLPDDRRTAAPYPPISLDEVVEAQPEVVLLPDESYPFSEEDAVLFQSLDIRRPAAGGFT